MAHAFPGCHICIYFLLYTDVRNAAGVPGIQLLAGITGGEFVGMKYFNQYFSSPMFLTTLKNTFVISAVSIIVGFPAPIILAMMINQIRNKNGNVRCRPRFISLILFR